MAGLDDSFIYRWVGNCRDDAGLAGLDATVGEGAVGAGGEDAGIGVANGKVLEDGA